MATIKPMIHKYCQNGTYMLLDVNSGIINVIDKTTYDVLDVYDGTNKDAVHQAFDGTYGKEEIDEILKERKSRWTPKPAKYQKGVLKIFSERAVSPMKGGYME